MLKNYLNIAFRHLWKDRLYSLINIVGLAAATLCLILAVVYWNDEHSFDGFHANNPNLYRVTTTFIDKKGADPKIVGVTAFIPWVKMFSFAALTSLSWISPQDPQTHSLMERVKSCFIHPQAEQLLLDGNHRSILTNGLSFQLALYSSIRGELMNPEPEE